MSRYRVAPFDLTGFRTGSLADRRSLVSVESAARPYRQGSGMPGFLASVPRILAGAELRELARLILVARAASKPVILGFGGHVVKCGLGPLVVDLLRRQLVTALCTNGSGAIHDIELGLVGHTSENVEQRLRDGTFGSARETQQVFAAASTRAVTEGIGLGEALCATLAEMSPDFGEHSLLLGAYAVAAPLTVHVAIGTDTVHLDPLLSPAELGAASHHDLRLLAALVAELDGGGVYLNFGSAVILPEVFLKAVTAVRNRGQRLEGLITANFDFFQHYRPRQNVLSRPTQPDGRGFAMTGHHELMLPLLAALLIEPESNP